MYTPKWSLAALPGTSTDICCVQNTANLFQAPCSLPPAHGVSGEPVARSAGTGAGTTGVEDRECKVGAVDMASRERGPCGWCSPTSVAASETKLVREDAAGPPTADTGFSLHVVVLAVRASAPPSAPPSAPQRESGIPAAWDWCVTPDTLGTLDSMQCISIPKGVSSMSR